MPAQPQARLLRGPAVSPLLDTAVSYGLDMLCRLAASLLPLNSSALASQLRRAASFVYVLASLASALPLLERFGAARVLVISDRACAPRLARCSDPI